MKNLWLHYFVLLIHVGAGLFWLGWMVFIFFLLIPVLQQKVPDRIQEILPALKTRIRSVVFWLIVVIILTGLHNAYYNGLYHWDRLLNTAYGQRFLVKVSAALVLFTVYVLAPYLTKTKAENDTNKDDEKITVVLHVIAFTAGMLAAFLGFTL